ncbi:MAG: pseudouridine synthase [Bdellovibrionota bacterium]
MDGVESLPTILTKEFAILAREKDFVAITKPPGYHVHQPEFPRRRVSKDVICLQILRAQIEEYLFPVHRIDVATEGVLVFALNKESASALCQQFQNGVVKKTYFTIVRGWADDEGVIDIPLELDSTEVPVPSLTRYKTHQRVELPFAVGKRHATARYSLVEAWPETGRYHQIRRHFGRLSHPVVGDREHGDSNHNRFFREKLGEGGLWLKAHAIEFDHPADGTKVRIGSEWSERWLRMFDKLGFSVPTSARGGDQP